MQGGFEEWFISFKEKNKYHQEKNLFYQLKIHLSKNNFNGWVISLRQELKLAVGVREALSWLKGRHFSYIQVELDAKLVIEGLNMDSNVFTLDLIFSDIKEKLRSFVEISFLFYKQDVNMTIHLLVRDFISRPGCVE